MGMQVSLAGTRTPSLTWKHIRRDIWLPRTLLLLVALVPVLFFRRNYDDRLVYLHSGLVDVLSALVCWRAGNRAAAERARWYLLASSQAIGALAYFAAVLRDYSVVSYEHAAWTGNLTIAISRTLLVPALLGSRLGRGSLVRALDIGLIVLCSAMLMFALGSGQLAAEGHGRVWTSLLSWLLLCLLSACTGLVHARPGLQFFLRTAFRYLLATVLAAFTVNVVLLEFFPTAPDVLANFLIPLPSILLCFFAVAPSTSVSQRQFHLDFSMADTLQSSLLTLAGVALTLFAFRSHVAWLATFVMLAVLCHTVRTQAFYSHLLRERSRLRSEATHLERLATLDGLTGIPNRRWFEAEIQPWLANPANYPCSLILADVDRFKQINDNHGHTAGDHVLRSVAEVLQQLIVPVPGASIARLGGDEFAALLSNGDAEQTAAFAERIRVGVQGIETLHDIPVSVSVGASTAVSIISRTDLLQSADQALYRVKANGRNGVAWHTAIPNPGTAPVAHIPGAVSPP